MRAEHLKNPHPLSKGRMGGGYIKGGQESYTFQVLGLTRPRGGGVGGLYESVLLTLKSSRILQRQRLDQQCPTRFSWITLAMSHLFHASGAIYPIAEH